MDSGLKKFTDPVSLLRFLDPLDVRRIFDYCFKEWFCHARHCRQGKLRCGFDTSDRPRPTTSGGALCCESLIPTGPHWRYTVFDTSFVQRRIKYSHAPSNVMPTISVAVL